MDNERITDPGWYWYETEYPDEGLCGPFATRAEALAEGVLVHDGNAEEVGVVYFDGTAVIGKPPTNDGGKQP